MLLKTRLRSSVHEGGAEKYGKKIVGAGGKTSRGVVFNWCLILE